MKKHPISRKPKHPIKWREPDKMKRKNKHDESEKLKPLYQNPTPVTLSPHDPPSQPERGEDGFLILRRKEGAK